VLARLSVYEPDRPARQYILDERSRYLIGRDETCTVSLDDERLSRRHAKIEFVDGAWWLSDLCSKNGTLINGRPITRYMLTDRQWIEIGGVIACFDLVSTETLDADRRRITERWQTSVELSRTLKPSQDLEILLQHALQSFIEVAGAERGFVMLRQANGEMALGTSIAAGSRTFNGSRSVVSQTVEEKRPVVCSDVSFDSLLVHQASIVGGGISALACLPLTVGEQMLGVIYVDSREAGKHFTELDVEILQALADHSALVIGVSRLRDEIVDLSEMLPAELSREPPADRTLIDKLQSLLPKLDRPDKAPVAGVAAAGADN
jgi:pSer/pThr/pTyr-binding forkhead associated (FHA) protein